MVSWEFELHSMTSMRLQQALEIDTFPIIGMPMTDLRVGSLT